MLADEKGRVSQNGMRQDSAHTAEDDKMVSISVRFSQGAWNAIRGVAVANNVSMAELVRLAVSGNLEKYLGTIRIVDPEQATEIKDLLQEVLGEMTRIRMELNRIGVNYNQEVRLKNLQNKYKGKLSSYDIQCMMREKDEIDRECQGFSRADMNRLMDEYMSATTKVGEALWRIVE